ncbi:MAG TPA: ankyrin repeat domain-containing protein [Rickettsia endosymbiont of Pyrocoelia pectoralis]|nr:ankyrin repeat domain-containing protein [Rickettsia endosymbiont of Pyrocoelia pectoralis]
MFENLMKLLNTFEMRRIEDLITEMNADELSKVNYNNDTALILAAKRGNVIGFDRICKLLIDRMNDQSINVISRDGYTALTWAAAKDNEEICKLLIPKMSIKAINAVTVRGYITKYGYTALTCAVERGLEEVCKLLIPKMFIETINHVNSNGETVLSIAKNKGLKNICDLLYKIDDFQKLVYGINDKVNTNITISAKGKAIIKDTIEEMIHKAKELNNTSDIEQITSDIQELLVNKPMKSKFMAIDEKLDDLIEQQNIPDDISVLSGDSAFG